MDNVVAAVVDNHNFDNHNLDFDLRSGKKETHIIYHVIKLCLKKLYQFLIHTYVQYHGIDCLHNINMI